MLSKARKTGKKKARNLIAIIIKEEVKKKVRIISYGKFVHRPKRLIN